jgi:cytidyltransferase-like protein
MTRTVLVFGTFDGLDEGHRAFLKHAAEHGERLVVAVARDTHVKTLKGHVPKHGEGERMKMVETIPEVADVLLSDETLGTYQIIQDVKPAIIVLGFDQDVLGIDLHAWLEKTGRSIPVVRLPIYAPPTNLG